MPRLSRVVLACAAGAAAVSVGPMARAIGQAPVPAVVTFDGYHGYRDVKTAIDRLAAGYPDLARVSSIGRDLRGFDLWMIEITNQKTGPAGEKPALWADGNIDGDEPASTEVVLELAQRALARYGADPEITRLLDTTALYLVPMANPFMADQFVTAPVRGPSGTNARPRDDDRDQKLDEDGPEDLDGDGQILTMRVRARTGFFRTDPRNPRLLVRRAGTEAGEWMVYAEGLDNDRDGRVNEDPIGGVALNRNFPFDWKPEAMQEGAGEFALSEPESRAIAEFLNGHPNIGLVINGHTGPDAAQVFRVYASRPDSAIPPADLAALKALGDELGRIVPGAKMTSPYGPIAVTRVGRLEYGFGLFTDWAYEMHGALALAPEYGMVPGDADKDGQVSEAELLRLSDAEFGGRLFVPWKTFPHPTLGRVEIGGFVKFTKPNPPPGRYLETLARTYAAGCLAWAARLPRLALRDVTTANEFGGITIRAVLENLGALPTNVTERAMANRIAPPVVVTLTVSPGVTILGETARQELGHLPGVSAASGGKNARELTWAVRLPPIGNVPHWAEITVISAKAGTIRRRLSLN
jgi:hypothetical protein